MSANNYSVCPKCGGTDGECLSCGHHHEAERTLREDWEIGIWKGKFHISYGATCSKCGFEFGYVREEDPIDQS